MIETTENISPVLAIETSGNLCSAAIMIDNQTYSESKVNKKNVHSEILFELIADSLSKLKLTIANINSVAVSEGPGSFTGLRIGMAAAKGIADGAGIPIIAVPTFDALAFEIASYMNSGEDFCIANKANRDEYYFAAYRADGQNVSVIEKLKVVKNTNVEQLSFGMGNIYGNYINNSVVEICSPSAISIARWAYIYGMDLLTFEYNYLEPNYLKNFKVKVKK